MGDLLPGRACAFSDRAVQNSWVVGIMEPEACHREIVISSIRSREAQHLLRHIGEYLMADRNRSETTQLSLMAPAPMAIAA